MTAFGEYADDGTASAMKARDYKDATDLVAHALRGEGFDASEDGTGRGTPLVPVGVTLHGTDGTQSVASLTEVSSSLRARIPSGVENSTTTAVMQPVAFHNRQDSDVSGEITHPIGAKDNGMAVAQPVAIEDPVPPLMARSSRGGAQTLSPGHQTDGHMVAAAMQVRRLTPVECERLQGFPDGYTAIPWRNKPASECPDGPRYKALGNSMAVPVMRWIGERINQVQTL